ncbi:signal protein [Actinomadura formosensis]|uniref:signal protein n=1 Tax=Actinomadura formosensis TaxID=60706 RepID=UPI001A954F6F|nr:signal protein [Actinomadura formosensis]
MIRARLVVPFTVLALATGCTETGPDDTAESPRAEAATASAPASPSERASIGMRNSGEVQSAWWSWAASAPPKQNPVEDATGARCAVGQPSGVWFLAGTFGGSVKRRCSVPHDRTLVAPVVNLHGSKEDCAAFMRTAAGTVKLDGKEVPLKRWAATPITITGSVGNPVTSVEGPVKEHGCGLWAMIPPPSPGPHTVGIRGSSGNFRLAVDYELTMTN